MRFRSSFLLILVCMACGGGSTSPAGSGAADAPVAKTAEAPASPSAPKATRGSERTATLLRTHIAFLASDEMGGRPTPSPQLDEAASYIAKHFEALGLSAPEIAPRYQQRFVCGRGPEDAANVIGILQGKDADAGAIIVSAHYDHIDAKRTGPDRIYNGANDNASGVAAMMEMARVLATRDERPKRTVVFVAFCGEELGLQGSKHYVKAPAWPLRATVAHINLEMLGRTDSSPERLWMTGMELSDLGEPLEAALKREGIELVASSKIGWQEAKAFNRSDNFPLARAGVIAHTISAGRLDEYYHSVDDEAHRLDFQAIARFTHALANAVATLADSDVRPQWTERGRETGLGDPPAGPPPPSAPERSGGRIEDGPSETQAGDSKAP